MATPQNCIECKNQTVSLISTLEGPVCYQYFFGAEEPFEETLHYSS